MIRLSKLAAAVVFLFAATLSHSQINPKKVYLVTNKNAPDSAKIAALYCELRGVPKENVIELGGFPEEAGKISKADYFEKLENPLIKELVKRGAINAMPLGKKDKYGRDDYALMSHDVDFIIMCKGVPWGVHSSDPQKKQTQGVFSPSTDASSVDSELAARFLKSKTLDGPLSNPLYNNLANRRMFSAVGVLRVARLDGATLKDVENSLRQTVYAEKEGARGAVYIDKAQKSKLADGWLEKAGAQLEAAYFETFVDNQKALLGYADRLDGLAFYFGWYEVRMDGYFLVDRFHTAPGAVGIHIFSFSAANMRDATGWTPGFVHIGGGFTVGNVFEPYLTGTHNPEVMVKALLAGMSAGEAAYAAIPGLSWQNVCVGDPMYMPFKVSLEEQIKNIDSGRIDLYSQYAVIRMMNKMIMENRDAKGAAAFGREYLGKIPSQALIWKLIGLSDDKAEKDRLALRLFEEKPWTDPMFFGLCIRLTEYFLLTTDRAMHKKVMDIYDGMLASPTNDSFERYIMSRARALNTKKSVEMLPNVLATAKKLDAADIRKAEEKKKAE